MARLLERRLLATNLLETRGNGRIVAQGGGDKVNRARPTTRDVAMRLESVIATRNI